MMMITSVWILPAFLLKKTILLLDLWRDVSKDFILWHQQIHWLNKENGCKSYLKQLLDYMYSSLHSVYQSLDQSQWSLILFLQLGHIHVTWPVVSSLYSCIFFHSFCVPCMPFSGDLARRQRLFNKWVLLQMPSSIFVWYIILEKPFITLKSQEELMAYKEWAQLALVWEVLRD